MAKNNLERRNEILEKIARDTAKMRHHQKNYFRTRSREEMQEAVRLEGIVDNLLDSLTRVNGYLRGERPAQAELFE